MPTRPRLTRPRPTRPRPTRLPRTRKPKPRPRRTRKPRTRKQSQGQGRQGSRGEGQGREAGQRRQGRSAKEVNAVAVERDPARVAGFSFAQGDRDRSATMTIASGDARAPSPSNPNPPAMADSRDYPTLADTVGNTPLVRLQRMPGTTTNVILGKLEGNNPAGSVKDRPALSMIVEAERRGDIRPGDTLIEATSGNTGIALAMVAAIKGYRLILVMPDNQSLERVQTMRAYGAELVQVTKAAGMEGARDLADRMQAEGKGYILNQFANPDNPLAHYRTTGPEIWRDTGGRITHFVSAMGTTGTIMGVSKYPEGKESGDHDRRRAAGGGRVHPRHPQMAGRIPAEDLRRHARRPHGIRHAGRGRGHGAPPRARGGHLRRHLGGRRVRGGVAHLARGPRRDHRLRRLRPRRPLPVDRRVSRVTPDPRLRHRNGARCRRHPAHQRPSRGSCPMPR